MLGNEAESNFPLFIILKFLHNISGFAPTKFSYFGLTKSSKTLSLANMSLVQEIVRIPRLDGKLNVLESYLGISLPVQDQGSVGQQLWQDVLGLVLDIVRQHA